ncbi:adenylyl-sulfate kinase [Methylacidimicrobium sp. B4]|uniref:adenylyl-sulfate kinase n=1 Tax=Methylacidimicrobium sp. B4 TaxID=2796139 RepID=UPI001A903CEA|nr:adenylyl-sulfate kinase [Methylacidimicrobium sp. B4]QSR85596.1 adenylyl-sulfate kinase [Methylacidimicrobium sp. B4]
MHFSASEEVLPIVVIGHVDHGKSTLIGRLLFDTGSVPEGKAEELARAAAAEGVPFEHAFLLDSLLEEQAQNVTIDTTEIRFRTERRRYAIIDAPGHKEFLKNMLSGAARAQAAVLVVDAREGVREQTRRHAMLLPILGIRHILAAVNKMDLVDYSEDRYREISDSLTALFAELGLPEPTSLPLSAREGENIVQPSARMPWFGGGALLEALDSVPSPSRLDALPLRFAVQDVYRRGADRLVAGRLETGTLRVGEELLFWPGRKRARLRSFAEWPPESTPREASAGRSTALILEEEIFVERGMIASSLDHGPIEAREFPAKMFWLGPDPLRLGETYELRLMTQSVGARVTEVDRVIDAETLSVQDSCKPGVEANEIAEVLVRTQRPLAFDNASEIAQTGRFILAKDGRILGGGIVLGARYPRASLPPVHQSSPLFWTEGEIDRNERARALGHRGAILWFTGLSGAGKSTLAIQLEAQLFRRGIWAYVLDGDNLRHGLSSDLGFSAQDRRENIRRAAEAARVLADAGLVAIVALISPFRADRRKAREIAEAAGIPFREIFVHAPLEVCRARDPKALYARAERGEIPEFTGVDSPYEVPENAELELPTHQLSPAECLERLTKLAQAAIALPNRPSLREDPAANI